VRDEARAAVEAPTARLEGVSKRYGRETAVEAASFELRPAETVALVGHNGAGKTTLIKLMLGLIRPTAGRIEVLGRVPTERRAEVQRRIGFLPENVAFSPSLTGRELMAFYSRLKGESRARQAALLEEVGLAHAARRRVGTYSKGMRQRLGLAQAMLGEPRLLLLDEPTSGLDPELRLGFYEAVRRLKEGGATVLLSSHALTELEERADRVVIMHRGRKAADGDMETLRREADLPVRLRLEVSGDWREAHGASLPAVDLRRDGRRIELTVRGERKMEALRAVAALGDVVRDLAILPPTLDELYAHVLRGREARE
jgi:Cu-processing system ATP-binding protein